MKAEYDDHTRETAGYEPMEDYDFWALYGSVITGTAALVVFILCVWAGGLILKHLAGA